MAKLDETIHQATRLRIMAALNALEPGEPGLDFTRLKAMTGATDGNLGSHLDTLAKVGYVTVEKSFVDRKPKTRVTTTRAGRRAFAEHVAFLKSVIDGSDPPA